MSRHQWDLEVSNYWPWGYTAMKNGACTMGALLSTIRVIHMADGGGGCDVRDYRVSALVNDEEEGADIAHQKHPNNSEIIRWVSEIISSTLWANRGRSIETWAGVMMGFHVALRLGGGTNIGRAGRIFGFD